MAPTLVAGAISGLTVIGDPVVVSLSNELVGLLSDQLYQSPVKAIEELVVNSYDADAKECRIFVPLPSDEKTNYIVMYDDGVGMDRDGLVNLWQIGRSNKRETEIQKRRKRKQIGRFGIGKLATYAVANQLTYITKSNGKILSITINFRDFSASPTGANNPISLPVREISDWEKLQVTLQPMLDAACIKINNSTTSWTITILEDLKPDKTKKLTPNLLDWILSTAMPLASDFHLYLNCKLIVSSKESLEKWADFSIGELPSKRIASLIETTKEEWTVEKDKLVSPSFPSGVSGRVIVTKKTLLGTKSDDLSRSHGFFIRVRERLVNASDPLFVEKALIHGVFNRFRADIQADDLDGELKASRETFEESSLKEKFRILLREIFNEAVSRYEAQTKEPNQGQRRQEGNKEIVAPLLVEYPIADALLEYSLSANPQGAEADEGWFYLDVGKDVDLKHLVQKLYNDPRSKYRYVYSQSGRASRLVKFDPNASTFWINEDHELALEYSEGQARIFLEDFVTAETLLEIYLRESQVPAHIAGEVLERRDTLLRSLAKDHIYSLKTIANSIRSAAADERELEILLVVAARALGFVATHVSNSHKPDGIARFVDYPDGEKKITLEAKSSKDVPSLGAIDFAGLFEHMHMKNEEYDGCLLVAPDYPGGNNDDDTAAANRARQLKVSCWTVAQLARFIEAAEARHLNAKHLLDIVLNYFSPQEVERAIDKLLLEETSDFHSIYIGIIQALNQLQTALLDSQRTVEMVGALLALQPEFKGIELSQVTKAVQELANASQGAMQLRDRNILIYVSLDELARRVAGLTKQSGEPRRLSNFRSHE